MGQLSGEKQTAPLDCGHALLLAQTGGKPKFRGLRGKEKPDSNLIRPRQTVSDGQL